MKTNDFARIAAVVRAAWLVIGISLVLFLVLEATASLVLSAINRAREDASAAGDYRALADSYDHAAWAPDYYREFQASSKVAWSPYVYWRREAFAGTYIKINGQGIRRTVPEVVQSASPTAPFRIFMFGGSALWGTGVRDEFTVPSLLARELLGQGIAAEITNFGETGYVSTQEVIALMLELRAHRIPDLVIFYDGVNDVFSAYQQATAGLPQNEMHRTLEFNLSQPDEWSRSLGVAFDSFAQSLSVVRAARGALRVVGAPTESDGPAQGNGVAKTTDVSAAVLKTYEGNMRILQGLGAQYGFRTFFFGSRRFFRSRL